LYVALRQAGLEMRMEQQTYYQAVRCGVAMAMAEERAASPLLAGLGDEAYRAGLSRLAAVCRTEGEEALLASHFCLAQVAAWRPA